MFKYFGEVVKIHGLVVSAVWWLIMLSVDGYLTNLHPTLPFWSWRQNDCLAGHQYNIPYHATLFKKRRGPNRRIISVKMASKKDMRRLDLGKTTSIEANVDHESAVSLISVLNRSHPLHRAAEG